MPFPPPFVVVALACVWMVIAEAISPSETLKRAMNTNNCASWDCVAEDQACATSGQCVSAVPPRSSFVSTSRVISFADSAAAAPLQNPRTANVTLAYSGLREQLVGASSGYSKLVAPAKPGGSNKPPIKLRLAAALASGTTRFSGENKGGVRKNNLLQFV